MRFLSQLLSLFMIAPTGAWSTEPVQCDRFEGDTVDHPILEDREVLPADTLPTGEYVCHSGNKSGTVTRRYDGEFEGHRYYASLSNGFVAVASTGLKEGTSNQRPYWVITCHYDATLDDRMCGVHQGDLMVAILNGQLRVKVGRNYRGSSIIALRVDDLAPVTIEAYKAGEWDHEALYQTLAAGKIVRTRYEARIDGVQDALVSLAGLVPAVTLMRQLYPVLTRPN